MEIKFYNYLHDDAMKIREQVFVHEQGFIDLPDKTDEIATHIVIYDNNIAVSCCRIFQKDERDIWFLGRMAVIKSYRNKGIGKQMLNAAEAFVTEMNASELMLHSQLHAVGFYEKCNYTAVSSVEYEQGEPHVWMKKEFGW
ncbi:MAG: GNAT family N-acetyltransferase [Clostridia bacterium]|nr:GNAT family N-acetyltransferase [Clostridia bacterium]